MVKSIRIFFFCSLLIGNHAMSQTLDSLWALRSQLYDAGKYDEALVIAKKLTSNSDSTLNTTGLGNDLLWEASIYRQLKNDKATEESYKKAILAFKTSADDLQKYAAANNSLGIFYSNRDKVDEAEKAYLEALRVYKSLPGDTATVYISVQENLITLYTNNDNFKKLADVFAEQIAVMKKHGRIDSLMGAKLNQLAVSYHKQKQYELAQKIYNESKRILTTTVGLKNPLYLTMLQNMKVLYEVMDKKDSLILNLEEIKQVQFFTQGAQSLEYALTSNELALLYEKNGKLLNAKSNYQNALKVFKKAGDIPNYFTVLSNLSKLYKKLKDDVSAISVYEELLPYQKDSLPKSLLEYGNSLNSLGVLWSNKGDETKAVLYYKKAIDAWKSDTAFNANRVVAQNNLYSSYNALKAHKELIEIDLERLTTAVKSKDLPKLSTINYRLGKSYEAMSRLDSAIFYYSEVEKLITLNPKIDFNEIEIIWNRIGKVYADNGDKKTVISYYLKYLKMLSATNRANSEDFAYQLNIIGVAYHSDNSLTDAMEYYTRSSKLYLKLKGQLNASYLQTLSNIGVLETLLKKYASANKAFFIALALGKKAFGDTSKMYIELLNSFGDVAFSRDKYEQALASYKKAQSLAQRFGTNKLQTECLINIAKSNAGLYKFDLAISQYHQVIKSKQTTSDTSSSSIVPIYNSLANLYSLKSAFKEAKKYFELSITMIGSNKALNALMINSLNGLGHMNKYLENYPASEIYYKKAILFAGEKFGDSSRQVRVSQNNLATLYTQMQQFDKALFYYSVAMNLKKGVDDISKDDVGFDNLAFLYNKMGNFAKAEEFYLKSLAVKSKNKVISNNYAETLMSLGSLYNSYGFYDKAGPYLTRALSLYKTLTGTQSDRYRGVLIKLAQFHRNNGEYAKGLNEANEALKIAEKLFGPKSLAYAETLDIKASALGSLFHINEAEACYLASIDIRKVILGTDNVVYGAYLFNLGQFYQQVDQYGKAIPLYEEALGAIEKSVGVNDLLYAKVLTDMALLHANLGNYAQSEKIYLQAKQIWKLKRGEKSLDYAIILNNMGQFYGDIGQYEKSIELYEQSASIRKELLGENDSQYGDVLNNLSVLYASVNNFSKAESLGLQSLDILRKTNSANWLGYARRISNLAVLYSSQNKVEKAEAYNREALSIFLKLFGKDNTSYASTLRNIGMNLEAANKIKEAKDAYLRVEQITLKILGNQHPDYTRILQNLFVLALKTDDFNLAQKYLNEIGTITISNLNSTFAVLSEKEKGNFLNRNIFLLNDFNSFIYKYPQASLETKTAAFNLLLKLKSLTLAETKSVFDRVKQSSDSSVVRIYKAWLADKNYLTFQYNLDKISQDPSLKLVEDRAETLEKELTRKSAEFRVGQKSLVADYANVRNKLAKDEVAIEFVSFNYYNKKWTDSTIYGAYLVKSMDSVPQFIPLCEAKKINKLFDVAGKSTTTMVNSFYRGTKVTNVNKDVLSDSLYNLIWKPLESYLVGVKKIHYSPAGKLYAIAFNALQDGNKKLLIDKFDLQQYTSTRELVFEDNSQTLSTSKSIALFGDATFSIDSTTLDTSLQEANNSVNYSLPTNRGGSSSYWSTLPGTLKEVSEIKSLFQSNNLGSSVFVQSNASEQNFKSLSSHSPQILHVATHGFFLPNPALNRDEKSKSTYALAQNPLLRSGLVLAGGNYAWGGGKPLAGREDGILTAYEISQLDLGQTDLVVLSACETALGDIKGSEGVFGLQRSFKMAGVKNMIVSLWQVPDKETAELMTSFYSNLLAGTPIDESFAIAQTAMRKKYDPFYWAAFVLIK